MRFGITQELAGVAHALDANAPIAVWATNVVQASRPLTNDVATSAFFATVQPHQQIFFFRSEGIDVRGLVCIRNLGRTRHVRRKFQALVRAKSSSFPQLVGSKACGAADKSLM